jgi:hypothetical protein
LFAYLPEGSAVGYWLREGTDISKAPIVLLSLTGECGTLAPSLEVLLARMAVGEFEDFPEVELIYEAGSGAPDLREELADFLKAHTGIENLASLADAASSFETDIAEWVDETTTSHERALSRHPAMRAITEILKKHHPKAFQTFKAELDPEALEESILTIDIAWAGDFYTATIISAGRNDPLEVAESLKPHLSALREEAAAKKPGLGLWHSATLLISWQTVRFLPLYNVAPQFRRVQPSAAAFVADHERCPREARRIPNWLAKILL